MLLIKQIIWNFISWSVLSAAANEYTGAINWASKELD